MRRIALAIALVLTALYAQWPDRGGYRFLDSDTSAGPVFQWLDISQTGTRLALGDDDNAGPLALGTTFTYYWRDFDSVHICSNGWLSFTSSSHQFHHYPIPDPRDPDALAAPLWADLDPSQGGAVYFLADTVQRRFIVSWESVPLHGTSDICTFQAILDYHSGEILFQYLDVPQEMSAGGDSCSVGIENDSGTVGSGYLFDGMPLANRLHDSLAIRFYQLDYDVCPVAILWPMQNPLAGDTILPLVHVWNAGVMPATFPVTLLIGDAYQREVEVTTLRPLADTMLEFPCWIPAEDTYPMVVFTSFAGDEFTANDTATGLAVGSYVGQIAYDDGDPDTWFIRNGAPNADWAAAVRFTSPYGEYRLLGALIRVFDSQPFARVLVCPDSSGAPKLGAPYLHAESVSTSNPEQWLELDSDTLILSAGDLWLVAFWPRSALGPKIGEDRDLPIIGRSWFGSPTVRWFSYSAGDLLMRLKVDGRSAVAEPGPTRAERALACPNPFRRTTMVRFSAGPASGSGVFRVFDAVGSLIRSLPVSAGERSAVWDGRDDAGRPVPAGVYVLRSTGEAGALLVVKSE